MGPNLLSYQEQRKLGVKALQKPAELAWKELRNKVDEVDDKENRI